MINENPENLFNSLMAEIQILVHERKEIHVETLDQLFEYEQQGVDVRSHLLATNNRLIYARYCDHTKLARAGAVVLSDFVRKKSKLIEAPIIHSPEVRKGWRRADSVIGYYFMKLNSQLTIVLSDFVKKKSKFVEAPTIHHPEVRKGWRRADSFIGYYSMKLNRQLTADIM